MNEEKIRISIITVVYNGEDFLEETILSVINQTYENIEYIIIDGGSTDGTIDIIKKYENEIDYWVSEPDKGIYDAMNKGIKIASGDYVGILNADDWYSQDSCQLVAKAYTNNTDVEIIYGNMYLTDDKKNMLQLRSASDWKLYFGMSLNHPSTFIKAELYKEKLFDTSYKMAADYDLVLYWKLHKKVFYKIDAIMSYMRDGGASVINSNITKKEEKDIKKKLLGSFPFFFSEVILTINKVLKGIR